VNKLDSGTKISLTVLTWRAPKTLQSSLSSIKELLPFFDELILVCQESDPREMTIGANFGFRIIALEKNIGIQGGMKECFESARNELILFYENDLVLNQSVDKAKSLLTEAAAKLQKQEIDFVKFRFLPGNQNAKGKYFSKYWRVNNNKVRRRISGYLRFQKANRSLGTAIQYIWQKSLDAPGFNRISENFFQTTTQYGKWENRAVLTSKAYFRKLLKFAEANPSSRIVNGSPDLEHPLNCKKNRKWLIKQKSSFLIAVPGLFGHRRHDRAAIDEKWDMVDPVDEGGEVEVS